MQTLHAPITCINSLTEPELFVVCAARIFRESSTHPSSGCACLPRIFTAARLMSGLDAFLHLQIALSMDAQHTLTYEERSAHHVGHGELSLLRAIFSWQQDCTQTPQDVLWFISGRAIRRVAADAGRQFAREMAACGLLLPERVSGWHQPWSPIQRTAPGPGTQHVH